VDGVFVAAVSQFEPIVCTFLMATITLAVVLIMNFFFDNDIYVFEGRHHPREEFEEHGGEKAGAGI